MLLPIVINPVDATFRNTPTEVPMTQEERINQLTTAIYKQFCESMGSDIPSEEKPYRFQSYLQSELKVEVKEATEGSLRIIVECRTLEILERLWEDYRSGHLNAVAEKCLLTYDIQSRYNVVSVNLKTTISEDDYLACKCSLISRELIVKYA